MGIRRILAAAALACTSLSAQATLISDINQLLDQASGQYQAKRALLMNEQALQAFGDTTLVLSLPATELTTVAQAVLPDLRADQKLRDEGVTIDGLALEFADQSLVLSIRFQKVVGDVTVHASVKAVGLVATQGNRVVFNVIAKQLVVEDLDGDGWWNAIFGNEEIAQATSQALKVLMPLFNVALDREINSRPDRAVVGQFPITPLWKSEQGATPAGDLQIQIQAPSLWLQVKSSLVDVNRDGLVILAETTPTTTEPAQPALVKLPEDGLIQQITQVQMITRARAYHQALEQKLSTVLGRGVTVSDFRNSLGVFVPKSGLAAVLNSSFNALTPVTGNGKYSYSTSSSMDLHQPFPSIDCGKFISNCQFKNQCETDNCKRTVQRTIQDTCRVSCCLQTGLLGCIVPGLCDRACEKVISVVEEISSPACDAFRAAGQVNPMMCAEATILEATACAASNATAGGACVAVAGVKGWYEHNPFATLNSSVSVNDLPFTFKINRVTAAADLSSLQISATANATGPVNLNLSYERHLASVTLIPPLTWGQCQIPWAHSYNYQASATVNRDLEMQLSTHGKEDGTLVLHYTDPREWTAYGTISPAPLAHLFATNPAVTTGCPVLVFAGVTMATWEKAFTADEMRQALPAMTGENWPIKSEDPISLDLTVPPIVVVPDAPGTTSRTLKTTMVSTGLYAR